MVCNISHTAGLNPQRTENTHGLEKLTKNSSQ